jgi:nucleolar GTP-binding protein
MNFQNLQTISSHDFYLDVAFSRAKKRVDVLLGTTKIKHQKNEIYKAKDLDRARIECVRDQLRAQMDMILKSFPDFDGLSEFYGELIELYHSKKNLQKALSSLNWATKRIDDVAKQTLGKFKTLNSKESVEETRKAFYGRVSSIMKQIDPFLAELEVARKDLKSLPSVKDSLFTISIVGFPNVGKSTLLSKLTFSMPEAKAYPFTTKGLNLGYARINHEKVQFIDTPGSLNRDNKMNYIEKQAHLTMKYLADVLLYVFDLTEAYPLDQQIELYKRTIEEYDKPMLIYLSKTDLLTQEKINEFMEKYENIVTSPDDIMEKLEEIFL